MKRIQRVIRRVTLLFDNSYHRLDTVEWKASVRFTHELDRTHVWGDTELIQKEAVDHFGEKLKNIEGYEPDLVGILVALDFAGEEGRIIWMEDDEIEKEERLLKEKKENRV